MFGVSSPRVQPLMGPNAYKTYSLKMLRRHATCQEIDCPNYLNGWTFKVAHLMEDPKLNHMARTSGRQFREQELNGEMYLVYEPGQQCFSAATHTTVREDMLETPLLFVGRGDWRTFDRRGLPPDAMRHKTAADWVDDFANHQDALKTAYDRG